MTFVFKRFETIALKKNLPSVTEHIGTLLELLTDPWGNITLSKILNGDRCTEEEVLNLIKTEMGLVLIVRLEIMAEARLDIQALRLIEVCLQCVTNISSSHLFQSYTDEIIYIRDIYLILLVRTKNSAKVLNEVNQMSLVEGLKLVRRCTKGDRLARLRKSRIKMADVVANMALVSAMIHPITEEAVLHDMIEEWYNLHPDTQVLFRLLKNMMINAVSSQHIYLLGQLLVEKYGETEKLQCVELYIRALTVNLNELEKYKSNSDQEKVKESEVRLSKGFLLLADYLKDDIITCRECVLTAFSLNPTIICYEKLKELAIASGKLNFQRVQGRDDDCENNQSSINCEKRTIECHQDQGIKIDTGQLNGTELTEDVMPDIGLSSRYKVLPSPIQISDAQKIGIPQTMCDDLSTVISSARYQVLNWHLDWAELSSRCESYILSGKEVRSTEKELKYLNIDYNQFKDWPNDREYDTGIEKGFEEFIESESDEGFDTSSGSSKRKHSKLSNDETRDSLEYSYQVQAKIDETYVSNSSESEFDYKGNKKPKIKAKRKALLSISDSDTGTQDSRPDSLGSNNNFLNRINNKKKAKTVTEKNKNNTSNLLLPNNWPLKPGTPLKFSQFPQSADVIDIISIEEDAEDNMSPVTYDFPEKANNLKPVMSGLPKNSGKASPELADLSRKSRNVSPVTDSVVNIANNISPVARPAPSTGTNVEKPNYCIAENDLSLSTSLSPFNSPSKFSDPTVLKSLRMYRARKPATVSISNVPDKEKEKVLDKFTPMLSTIDLNPRILNRSKSVVKPADIITIDVESEPEIIDLVDSDDEVSADFSKKLPYDISSKMKLNFDNVLQNNAWNRKSAFSKPNPISDFARNLGLKSLDMIRPATSETTVQVVQFSNSARPLVTSTSNTTPITSPMYTMSQQNISASLGQVSCSSVGTTTTLIYTMPQQTTSVTHAQGSNNNLAPNTTVICTMPQQTSSLAQVRSTTSGNNESSKLAVTSTSSLPNRVLSGSGSQNVASIPSSSNLLYPVRNFFSSHPRQMYPQSQGVYLSRQSPERALLSPSLSTSTSTANVRSRTPPHELIVTSSENSNVSIGVIRLERISLAPSTEPNQPVPNLSPIKSPVSIRPQVACSSRQLYVRSGVARTLTAVSTQSQSVVTSSARLVTTTSTTTSSSGRSMPVTAHIQRVGYPRESSPSQNSAGIQLKYVFKEGILSATEEKQNIENDTESQNVSMVLSPEQIQQLLPKSTSRVDKSPAIDQDDHRSQGASLPKFQQAFGRQMYQNSSTATSSTTLTGSNEPPLNFTQHMQSSGVTTDSATSASMCTVLSKAVQTMNKDSEIANKSTTQSNIKSEQSDHIKMTVPGSTSTSTIQAATVSTSTNQVETQLTNSTSPIKSRINDRAASLTQTPVKFFCKVPVTIASSNLLQGKSVAILKTAVSPEKLTQTQAKYEVENRSKETVIRSNMSALLAAALQAQPQLRPVSSGISTTGMTSTQNQLKSSTEVEKKKPDQNHPQKTVVSKNYRKLSVMQQQPVTRYSKPVLQVSAASNSQNTVTSTPVVTIPIRTVLAAGQQTSTTSRISNDRIEVRSEPLVSPSPPDDPSSSSLLDQQLKEFESVFNKVKKTSQMKERTNSTTTVQIQPHLNLGQQILLTQPSSSTNVEFTTTSTNQTALFQSTSTNTIHDLQGERVSLTFISQPTSGATNTLIAGTNQKITTATPVVVVQSCSKPVASPALSVTSQSSSSPAPPSTPGSSSGKITTSAVVKQNKSNKSKTATKAAPTTTLKVSTLPKPQQKPQEDEQTTQRIYAILDKYAEQLRNSPELKNKPAPRRRSNPPTNPSQNSKRKKSTQTKSKLPSQQASCSSSGMEMSPGSEDLRTIGSEDSSNGVSQLSQTLNSPQSRQDDPSTPTGGDVSSETSESHDSRDARVQSRMVLTETSPGRAVLVQDNVPTQVLNVDASKLLAGKPLVVGSQTIVPQLVLPNVPGMQKMQLFPVPSDGRPLVVTKVPKMYRVHQVTMPRGSTSLLGPGSVVLRHMCGTPTVKQVKPTTISGISAQNLSSVIHSPNLTVTHNSALESGEAININLDNTILLNSTSPKSISFVHRSIPSSSYHSQEPPTSGSSVTTITTSATSAQKTTVAYSAADLNVSYIKDQGNTLTMRTQINVIPVSSPQDTKTVCRTGTATSTNLSCIELDDDISYTANDPRPTVKSDSSHLCSTQSNSNDAGRWVSTDSTKSSTADTTKKEDISEDFSNFQTSVSTLMSHRSSNSTFLPKQDISEGSVVMDNDHNLQLKEEVKPERPLQEPELCDEESVSSDSAGSGRVKNRSEEKSHLMPETSQDTGSPWPYNVTKIECLEKSESPCASAKQEDAESHSITLTHSQGRDYKKKVNNVENTIYQMAFKRSDRTKITTKEMERNAAVLERDLRLQKSLSEECEDLGVDEPSTSDLFPEAELLLDPDHSSRDSQIDLPSETFSQTLNSSSSCDSNAMSPMFPLSKRPTTYRSIQKSLSTISRSNRFLPIFNNPIYQYTEESTSGTVSSTRVDSPECHVVGYKFKSNKFSSNSDSNSPYMNKSLNTKGTDSPVHQKLSVGDQHKSSSSGTSTPVNGGESTASPNHDEMPNSCTSEETQCAQKISDDNCKDTEVDTTTDSDSNIDVLNASSSHDSPAETKSSFIPIPNPAATAPFTYGGNRSNLKFTSRKVPMKHEIWKNILKGNDNKEDLDSDMSDPDQVRTSDKRSTSTEEDLQSEGEARAKNGLGTESEDLQSTSDRIMRSTKKLKKRQGPLIKCSASKNKVPRKTESHCVEELLADIPSSTEICKNAASHHDMSRRSSLRGHIKKNCPCCNGSPDKKSTRTEKYQTVTCPTPTAFIVGVTNKKKPNCKSVVKSSHITKKR
ncbi:mucin-12-like isoform X2 [Homalodisca vitripennis]|nr:mucin-12-like isoform X2 [Homalodisca vitripennis]